MNLVCRRVLQDIITYQCRARVPSPIACQSRNFDPGGWLDGATALCVWVLGQTGGGSLSANGRLQGRLEVSRAFGDRQFNKVFRASDAVEFVQKSLKEGLPIASVTRRLVREAVGERCCIRDPPPFGVLCGIFSESS